jgi:tetratricopeptide (TPR) repeat protein
MQGRWKEAITANKSILESFPKDVDAYNRLGKAYIELGDYALAKEAYGQAIEIDPYNGIARKNLRRLSILSKSRIDVNAESRIIEPHHFIEETGKTGVINLCYLAAPDVLAKMAAGDRVNLKVSGTNLIVTNTRDEYLGEVEPRHEPRLIKLINGGNQYNAGIVSANEEKVTVIIREIYQHPSQEGQLSFPPRGLGKVRPYVGDTILRSELEHYEETEEETGYSIIDQETGAFIEEFHDTNNDKENEE